jgi:hypothetical protein
VAQKRVIGKSKAKQNKRKINSKVEAKGLGNVQGL